jgi:hypothetical protein
LRAAFIPVPFFFTSLFIIEIALGSMLLLRIAPAQDFRERPPVPDHNSQRLRSREPASVFI